MDTSFTLDFIITIACMLVSVAIAVGYTKATINKLKEDIRSLKESRINTNQKLGEIQIEQAKISTEIKHISVLVQEIRDGMKGK